MKFILALLFASTSLVTLGQQKKDSLVALDREVFLDTADNIISAKEFREKLRTGKFDNTIKFENGATVRSLVLNTPSEKTSVDNSLLTIGSPFPEFNLKRVDGKMVGSSSLKGKLVVISFWYIACKPCIDEIPNLNDVVKHYQDRKDIIFLAPSFDNWYRLNKFLTTHEFLYQTIVLSRELNQEAGIFAYPTHMVVDKKGIIKEIILGGQETEKKLIEAIEKVTDK